MIRELKAMNRPFIILIGFVTLTVIVSPVFCLGIILMMADCEAR